MNAACSASPLPGPQEVHRRNSENSSPSDNNTKSLNVDGKKNKKHLRSEARV